MSDAGTSQTYAEPIVALPAAPNPAELEDAEFYFRATEMAALAAWSRGKIDRAQFRRWLRSEGWQATALDDLTVLVEHVLTCERQMDEHSA